MAENQQHYSYLNFWPDDWKGAALAYLKLLADIAELQKQDDEIDHEERFRDFESCDLCDQIHTRVKWAEGFSQKFGETWAKKALENSTKGEAANAK